LEPLTGFFILEGLTFDIIGAYLVISGLLKTDFLLMEKLSDLKKVIKELTKQNMKMTQLYQESIEILDKTISSFSIDQHTKELEKAHKNSNEMKLNILEITVEYVHNFLAEVMHEKQYDKLRVRSGLPFLIGGFILQGIGVINQLM